MKKSYLFIIIGYIFFIFPNSLSLAGVPEGLPLSIPDDQWRPLYDNVDPALQESLEAALNRNKTWQSLINNKKLAIGLVDLSNPSKPRYARVNGRKMMYAASIPKLAILLAAFTAFEEGRLEKSSAIMEDLNLMIRKSDNPAATRMVDRVGGLRKIQAVLKDPRYKLYDTTRGGGLWLGRRFAKVGKRYPDPITGLSHGATVLQICRLYYLLAYGKIISPEVSSEMLQILSDPGLHHKFVYALERRAPRARLFRKSGTWKVWHSDSVLVWGPVWRRYILVAMVEYEKGEALLRELVPVIDDLLLESGFLK